MSLARPLARPLVRALPHSLIKGVGVPVGALTINGNPVVINGYFIIIGG